MHINIKFTETPHDDVIREYAEKKLSYVKKLLTEEEFEAAKCDVELKRDTHHHSGDVCTAEVTLRVHGKTYRVEKTEPTLEKAIDKAKDDIFNTVREDKGKEREKYLRGAAQAKEMLRNTEDE